MKKQSFISDLKKVGLVTIFVLLSVSSLANETDKKMDSWILIFGMGLELEPEYHGSNLYQLGVQPSLLLKYTSQNKIWSVESSLLNNTLKINLTDHISANTWINLEEGRTQSQSSVGALDGMGDIDDAIEFGGGLIYLATHQLKYFIAAQSYSKANIHKGGVGFLGLNYTLVNGKHLILNFNSDLSFANSQHLQAEFGITEQQSNQSKYQPYYIKSGLKSYGAGFNASFKINEHFFITSAIDYELLSTHIRKSPLIRSAGESAIELELSINYQL